MLLLYLLRPSSCNQSRHQPRRPDGLDLSSWNEHTLASNAVTAAIEPFTGADGAAMRGQVTRLHSCTQDVQCAYALWQSSSWTSGSRTQGPDMKLRKLLKHGSFPVSIMGSGA